jgi:aryl-alcohol dehydrogenase-like predicted oxidoreductase
MELGLGLYRFRQEGEHLIEKYLEQHGRIFDAAPNYFNGNAHALIAQSNQVAARCDDIKIWSKVGFPRCPDSRNNQINAGIVTPDEIVGNHALNPKLVRHQIAETRNELQNLKLHAVYLHNPEQQLLRLSRQKFWDLMTECVWELEGACADGIIQQWGISTWAGLGSQNGTSPPFSIDDWEVIARKVAGPANHFGLVQMPLSLARVQVLADFVQCGTGVIQDANRLGKMLVASSPMSGGALPPALNQEFRDVFGCKISSGQACILFLAAIPHISVCLISPRTINQLIDSMATAHMPALDRGALCRVVHLLIGL